MHLMPCCCHGCILLLAALLPSPSTTRPKQAQQHQAPQPATVHQHKACRHGHHLYRDSTSHLHPCSFTAAPHSQSAINLSIRLSNQPINQPVSQSANQSINQAINQPIYQSTNHSTNRSTNKPMNYLSIALFRGDQLQVAGQYLEFLVSQDRFEEAAALMPRLLKVPDAACLPFAAHCYQLWVLPPASRPSCSAIL